MSTTPSVLVPSAVIPSVAATAFTSSPSGKGTYIDNASFLNFSGTADTLTINIIQVGGTASNSNLRIQGFSIAAGASYMPLELQGKFLAPGSFVQWQSGAGNINGELTGRNITG